MTTADFETFDKDAIAEFTAKAEIDKLDHMWADRIGTLAVGHGFRAKRDESNESVRQFKRRLNAAAKYTYRELEWFPEQKNVKAENVTSWVVKIRSLDTKAQREAEEAKNGSQASQEGQQTTEGEGSTEGTSPDSNTPVGSRRASRG